MPAKSAPKKRGWKDTKNKIKNTKNLKLGVAVLCLIVVVLILGQLFNFVKTLISPWGFTSEFEKKYIWDSGFNINIIVQTNKTYLLNFNPKEEKATIIAIPDETYLDAGAGFGRWMLRSIFDLGESSKKGSGYKLVKTSTSYLFGVPIDGFIRFKGDSQTKALKNIIEQIRQNPVSGLGLISDIRSDLTPLELLRLKFALWNLRFDKVSFLNLADLNVYDTQRLADGSTVLVSDPIKLDSMMDFVDPNIRQENISIAVFNATDYPQLAQKAKRLITNLGGNVIIVANSSQKIKNTLIFGEKGDTLKRLNQIFLICKNKDTCGNIAAGEQIPSRAQINIFLGEDFARQ